MTDGAEWVNFPDMSAPFTLDVLIARAVENGVKLTDIAAAAGVDDASASYWATGKTIAEKDKIPGIARATGEPEQRVALARLRSLRVREDQRYARTVARLRREAEALRR